MPRRLTAQRRTGLGPGQRNSSPDGGELTTARIAQRFAPHAQPVAASVDQQCSEQTPAAPPLLTLSLGLRQLVAVVILVAWLPSLIVGAVFWLSRSTPVEGPVRAVKSTSFAGMAPEDVQSKQAAKIPPVLTAPATLEAKAGEEVNFPIALDGTDGVPARSTVAISGLPQGTTFSNGRPHGEREWAFRSDEIGDLYFVLPNNASGESKLRIQLIAPDGKFVADTETVLKVAVDPETALVLGALEGEHKPEAQALHEQDQEVVTKGAEAKLADLEAAKATSGDAVQLPPSNSAQTANDDAQSRIMLLDFVNLREGPSSSARVISEIPKGVKLRALGRKHGWVQVTNPATSETGWVYAGNVATASKLHLSAKRAVPKKTRSGSDDSLWTSLGEWLSSP